MKQADTSDELGNGVCAAFSLVELLVVLSLISALAMLITPGTQRVRAHAQEAVCAQNLRQWGTVFLLYAADHGEILPHPDDRRRDGGTYGSSAHPEHDEAWVDVLPPYMNETPWRDIPEGEKPGGGIWHCPATRLLRNDLWDPSRPNPRIPSRGNPTWFPYPY